MDVKLVKDLTDAFGPPFFEDEVRKLIYNRARELADEVIFDRMGNLLAVKGKGKSGPRVLLCAHMDEVGFVVVEITQEGLLRVEPVGAPSRTSILGKPVLVGKDKLPGVVATKAAHLLEKEEGDSLPKADSIFVDIGAASRDEASSKAPEGTPVTFATEFEDWGKFVKGKSFDDRIGCALLLEAMGKLEPPCEVWFGFTVQEEVGLRGARVICSKITPDVAIIVEGTAAGDFPPIKEDKAHVSLGRGPVITRMDKSIIVDQWLFEKAIEAAEKAGIPYQIKKAALGGTDAGAIALWKTGTKAVPISVPVRYIHSPVSLATKEDYDNTLRLLKELVGAMAKEAKR